DNNYEGSDRMDLLRAVIIGPPWTPYQNGLFFDVYLPVNYHQLAIYDLSFLHIKSERILSAVRDLVAHVRVSTHRHIRMLVLDIQHRIVLADPISPETTLKKIGDSAFSHTLSKFKHVTTITIIVVAFFHNLKHYASLGLEHHTLEDLRAFQLQSLLCDFPNVIYRVNCLRQLKSPFDASLGDIEFLA
nr:probable ubiquitin-conjugating enzyme E2 24 [Tanacetum cinerariifolium]